MESHQLSDLKMPEVFGCIILATDVVVATKYVVINNIIIVAQLKEHINTMGLF